MKIFEFLITNKDGKTRIEAVAAADGEIATAYDNALRLFKGCEVRLRRDVEYRWWYMAVGFAVGSIVSAIILFIILHNKY